MDKLRELLSEKGYLLLDGAMGTMLMSVGLDQGAPPEGWNLEHPEHVLQVHRQYIEAGSDIILTNTFGGSSFRLKLHDLQDRVVELNKSAASIARRAADNAPKTVLVGGSMGPTGELLEPLGTMTFDRARMAFAEQAKGLSEGGVDLLWIETMSDLGEVRAAIEGARSESDLPIVATLSFDTHGRTMMGVTPRQALEILQPYDLLAVGANCGSNLPDTEAAVQAMRAGDDRILIVSKANAGIPHWEGDDLVYDGTPDVMAAHARRARALGAQLIGSCCGSTSEHVKAMSRALAEPVGTDLALQAISASSNGDLSPNEAPTGSRRRKRRRRTRRSPR